MKFISKGEFKEN